MAGRQVSKGGEAPGVQALLDLQREAFSLALRVTRSRADSMRAGAALTVLAVTGGGAWYLSRDRVKSWLR